MRPTVASLAKQRAAITTREKIIGKHGQVIAKNGSSKALLGSVRQDNLTRKQAMKPQQYDAADRQLYQARILWYQFLGRGLKREEERADAFPSNLAPEIDVGLTVIRHAYETSTDLNLRSLLLNMRVKGGWKYSWDWDLLSLSLFSRRGDLRRWFWKYLRTLDSWGTMIIPAVSHALLRGQYAVVSEFLQNEPTVLFQVVQPSHFNNVDDIRRAAFSRALRDYEDSKAIDVLLSLIDSPWPMTCGEFEDLMQFLRQRPSRQDHSNLARVLGTSARHFLCTVLVRYRYRYH
jgi:hypothetical protein